MQLFLNSFGLRDCALIQLAQALAIAVSFVGENYGCNLHLLLNTIKGDDCAKKHPDRVGWTLKRLSLVVSQCRFKPLGSIVTKIANGASCKWHQARALREHTFAKEISYPFSRHHGKAFRFAFDPTEDNEYFYFDADPNDAADQ